MTVKSINFRNLQRLSSKALSGLLADDELTVVVSGKNTFAVRSLTAANLAQAKTAEVATPVLEREKKEDKPMAETVYCPGCDEKKDTIRDLKAAAEKAAAAHTLALQEKTREAEGAAAQITSLKAQVEAAQKQDPPAPEFPSVDEFVGHCANCATHKPQLRQFMDKVMNAMSPDEVKSQMKRLKIDEAPDRITIGIGDRELRK
jgi:hypothetical protein